MPIEIMELNIRARVTEQNTETTTQANQRTSGRQEDSDDCAGRATRRAAQAATNILNRRNER